MNEKLDSRINNALFDYIEDNEIVSVGDSVLGEQFLMNLINKIKKQRLGIKLIPSSNRFQKIISKNKVQLANFDEDEIDLAIDFVDSVDKQFDFVKQNSSSLVRDKMIALSAVESIVVTEEKNYSEELNRVIPVESIEFGLKKTLIQLENFGKASIRMFNGKKVSTETGFIVIDVQIDGVYQLEDIEFELKNVPGVLETGLFIKMADRVILQGKNISIKSRIQENKLAKLIRSPLH